MTAKSKRARKPTDTEPAKIFLKKKSIATKEPSPPEPTEFGDN